ncbi:hypothetical protein EVAR_43206_1 [Eumeta japonica]|uniref:Uncharacterized protein n=1 Tax=Eumeta variegata TaxID=151549 RepID=A0A4C1WSF5_EUMVA|nr:hypothetical protein EVAR_43206_1 [Eumeta japonica]
MIYAPPAAPCARAAGPLINARKSGKNPARGLKRCEAPPRPCGLKSEARAGRISITLNAVNAQRRDAPLPCHIMTFNDNANRARTSKKLYSNRFLYDDCDAIRLLYVAPARASRKTSAVVVACYNFC